MKNVAQYPFVLYDAESESVLLEQKAENKFRASRKEASRMRACEMTRENRWLPPTVPRSGLRSVGRLNFLPGPLTEIKQIGQNVNCNKVLKYCRSEACKKRTDFEDCTG